MKRIELINRIIARKEQIGITVENLAKPKIMHSTQPIDDATALDDISGLPNYLVIKFMLSERSMKQKRIILQSLL